MHVLPTRFSQAFQEVAKCSRITCNIYIYIYIYSTMHYFAVYYIVVKMLNSSLLMLFPGSFALFLVAFVLFAKKKKKKKKKAVKVLDIRY